MADDKRFPCKQCGAELTFAPGTASLECPYCGFSNRIPQSEDDVHELDFETHLNRLAQAAPCEEQRSVRCGACSAETVLARDVTADECPYCGSVLVAPPKLETALRPGGVLPFAFDRGQAHDAFRRWVDSRWFAPSALKKKALRDGGIDGVYLPYWTFDAATESFYRGERGDNYWDTEHYTTIENGKTVTRTRQVVRTRWTPVSGVVWRSFDDVLVLASASLPYDMTAKLEPWDLDNVTAYDESYLSGFRAERYQLELADGFGAARRTMAKAIRRAVEYDIGGDHQRVHSVRTRHDDVTFKYLLLPVWTSAYRYRGKVYRFVINGRTGEVQGQRPYSWVKILLLCLVVAAVVGGIVVAVSA